MLRCGLFITNKHIDLEKVISRRRGGVETPTSPFIVLRHAGKRLTLVTINSKFFGRHGAPVSPRVTPERPITTMVLGICLSTADNCQTTCRAQPPGEPIVLECSQHGRDLVMFVSIFVFF